MTESAIHFLRRVLGDDMRPVQEQLMTYHGATTGRLPRESQEGKSENDRQSQTVLRLLSK